MELPLCKPLIRDLSTPLSNARDSTASIHTGDVVVWMPCGMEREPFGDTPYTKILQFYEMQAQEAKRKGALGAVLFCPQCLSEARAAAFGATKAGLTLGIVFSADSSGNTPSGTSLLSSVITLQGLGVQRIAVLPKEPEALPPLLQEIACYSKIPLGVVLNAANDSHFTFMLSLAEQLPVSFVYTVGSPPLERLLQAEHSFRLPKKIEAPSLQKVSLLPVCSSQPFFLGDDFTFSPPVHCSVDMSQDFLEAEESGCDIIHVLVDSEEDAYNLGINSHMARLPLSIDAPSLACLEWALLHYHGRAMVQIHPSHDTDAVMELSQRYNAVLL